MALETKVSELIALVKSTLTKPEVVKEEKEVAAATPKVKEVKVKKKTVVKKAAKKAVKKVSKK